MALVRRHDYGVQSTWGCTECPWEIDVSNSRDPKEIPYEVQIVFNAHKCKATRNVSFIVDTDTK